MTDLSILIVSHGHEAMLPGCVDSLGPALAGLAAEVIVVDNLQGGGAAEALRCHTVTVLDNPAPQGFAANVNQAAAVAAGRCLLLLNPDTRHAGGRLADAIGLLDADPAAGIVGCTLFYPDGSLQQNFRRFPTPAFLLARGLGADRWPWQPGFYRRGLMQGERPGVPHAVDWVFGAFMLLRRADFTRLGGMDNGFRLYYEDADLCRRFGRAGLSTVLLPNLRFVHDHARASAAAPFTAVWAWHVASAARYFWKAARGGVLV